METPQKYKIISLFKRLYQDYIHKYISQLVLATILLIICSGALSLQPILLQVSFDKIFKEKNTDYLLFIPLAIIAIFVVQAIATYFASLVMNKFVQNISTNMRKNLFRHIIDYEIEFYSRNNSGNLITRIINEVGLVSSAISTVFNGIFRQILSSLGLIAVMFYQSFELTVISLSAFVFAYYPIIRITSRLKKLARQTNEKTGDMATNLLENFAGIKVIKAYGKEEAEINRTNKYLDEIKRLSIKSARVAGITAPLMQILAGLAVGFVIWYGGYELIHNRMTEGNLIAFITSLLMVSRPIRSLGGLSGSITQGLAAAERFYKIIDEKPTFKARDYGTKLQVTNAEIKFDNVSFIYPDGTKALDDITITFAAGKKTALVGHSGSGKTTIFNMLLKFYDISSGNITIDGQSLNSASIESTRANMAIVSQDIFIFDDTARANIAYGKENATEEEIITAAKAAHCHEFILGLPNGYNTKLGFFGESLSGGQKQRIAIARAFLRNAPILLLDEATSALDPKTEKDIQLAIDELSQNRTTIVIAHRLSTVMNADKMIVLDSGKIVASGTHGELEKTSDIYRKLFAI